MFIHQKYIKKSLESTDGESASGTTDKRSTRASSEQFEIRRDCLFCGTVVEKSDPKLNTPKSSLTATDKFVHNISEICDNRAEYWSMTVKCRLQYCSRDLHAWDCKYHHVCYANFRTGRHTPEKFRVGPSDLKRSKVGKPQNEDQLQTLDEMCSCFEQSDEEQLTVTALSDKMREYLIDPSFGSYSNQYLKTKLKEHYGDSTVIAEGEGRQDIVTMRETCSRILRSHFKNAGTDDEEAQKREIIQTAARLIKSDIKIFVTSDIETYPQTADLKTVNAILYLPTSLRVLLESLFVGKYTTRRKATIGQAIIQDVRPRAVIAPLQLGLAVQTHHLYRSRFLVETLPAMGFCSSYHDLVTLDGHGTFHSMGIVAAITPKSQISMRVPRKPVSTLAITEESRIDIIEFSRFSRYAAKSIVFEQLPTYQLLESNIDILWEISLKFSCTTPQW